MVLVIADKSTKISVIVIDLFTLRGRLFELLQREFDFPQQEFELPQSEFELPHREFELRQREFELLQREFELLQRGPRHPNAAATSTIPLRGISGFAGIVDVEGRLCGDW